MAMPQHFLLSATARTLSLSAVARMSDEEALQRLAAIRWADNDGEPYCPKCGCAKVYTYTTRKLWKCTACRYQFSVTAGTIFADRKLSVRDYLLAIAIFVKAPRGTARSS
jgi:transposase-like protein